MDLRLIVAVSRNGVIGCCGNLPWRQSADLQWFKKLTWNRPIIMGRKTFESIGRVLPGRKSIVLTRQRRFEFSIPDVEFAYDFDEAVQKAQFVPIAFVIGGGEVFRQAMDRVSTIYRTTIHADVVGDTYFPSLDPQEWKVVQRESHRADERNENDYTFEVLQRVGDALPITNTAGIEPTFHTTVNER